MRAADKIQHKILGGSAIFLPTAWQRYIIEGVPAPNVSTWSHLFALQLAVFFRSLV